ncbi:MAG: hypothetical protein ACJATV_001419 [Granulosicoccus sp.]|jgi:hypothetical protein
MSYLPNFDTLTTLAKEDPEALEDLRQKQVERLINNAPKQLQPRLRGLQFQIDAHRQLHLHSPMGSCMKISQLMHESFAELRGWLNQISGFNDPLRNYSDVNTSTENKMADILAFPSR